MNTSPIIVIAGPTASGKSSVAASLARSIGGEIISADSRQVYRFLDIGTNKAGIQNPSSGLWEIDGIAQYLISIIEPSGSFSAGDFVARANCLIGQIRARGKRPIIVGGTGLYIKALIDGLAPLPAPDEKLRAKLKQECEAQGREYLYLRLKEMDPQAAENNRHNTQRLIRAIEICMLSGKTISMLHEQTIPSTENFIQFALRWPRAELYENINLRAGKMIAEGLVDEAVAVVERGYSPDCTGLAGSIGYTHALACARGEISRHALADIIALETRHYAKRQLTWFNRDKRVTWIDTSDAEYSADKISRFIESFIDNHS